MSLDQGQGGYGGFSAAQRAAKFKELKRLMALGVVPPPSGACELCSDPSVALEYHSEDYSAPFKWSAPAMRMLCRHCHRSKLHGRFRNPEVWRVFLAHVRRGGYAKELSVPVIADELRLYRRFLSSGTRAQLRELRSRLAKPGDEWFSKLDAERPLSGVRPTQLGLFDSMSALTWLRN